jgi:hypothetical protein
LTDGGTPFSSASVALRNNDKTSIGARPDSSSSPSCSRSAVSRPGPVSWPGAARNSGGGECRPGRCSAPTAKSKSNVPESPVRSMATLPASAASVCADCAIDSPRYSLLIIPRAIPKRAPVHLDVTSADAGEEFPAATAERTAGQSTFDVRTARPSLPSLRAIVSVKTGVSYVLMGISSDWWPMTAVLAGTGSKPNVAAQWLFVVTAVSSHFLGLAWAWTRVLPWLRVTSTVRVICASLVSDRASGCDISGSLEVIGDAYTPRDIRSDRDRPSADAGSAFTARSGKVPQAWKRQWHRANAIVSA